MFIHCSIPFCFVQMIFANLMELDRIWKGMMNYVHWTCECSSVLVGHMTLNKDPIPTKWWSVCEAFPMQKTKKHQRNHNSLIVRQNSSPCTQLSGPSLRLPSSSRPIGKRAKTKNRSNLPTQAQAKLLPLLRSFLRKGHHQRKLSSFRQTSFSLGGVV